MALILFSCLLVSNKAILWDHCFFLLVLLELQDAIGDVDNLSLCVYKQELLPGGSAPNMIPLVYEHFGHWGSEAESFLCHLAKKSCTVEGQQNTVEFVTTGADFSQSLCKDATLKWC